MSISFGNFTNSWLAAIANPVGYSAQHVSLSTAVDDYTDGHNPKRESFVSEESYKTQRTQWIDACTSAVKSRDVGYSKANLNSRCAAKWDEANQSALDVMFAKAEEEKQAAIVQTKDNVKKLIAFAAITIILILIIFLIS
ncbi:MAG: hypothetical protein JST36_07520 [Bacteroidetes bacterium]|nr:hypothetical protein [Bacteroidota bacterium]